LTSLAKWPLSLELVEVLVLEAPQSLQSAVQTSSSPLELLSN
jgi:hypothetical protein